MELLRRYSARQLVTYQVIHVCLGYFRWLSSFHQRFHLRHVLSRKSVLSSFNLAFWDIVRQVCPDSGFWKGASYNFTFTIPALYPHDPPKVNNTCSIPQLVISGVSHQPQEHVNDAGIFQLVAPLCCDDDAVSLKWSSFLGLWVS